MSLMLPNRRLMLGRRLLYPRYVQDYLDRVTAADVAAGNTQGLERGVTDQFNVALQAMVADGSLGVSNQVLAQAASLIKAGCFMAGARTLSGALTPIAATMPAPTNFNFVSGDYDRKTGLVGDGVQKHLNSNRNNNADPQNSKHLVVYASTRSSESTIQAYMGATFATAPTSSSQILSGATAARLSTRANDATTVTSSGNLHSANGLFAVSRGSSSSYTARGSGNNETVSVASLSPASNNIFVFSRNLDGAATLFSDARLAFYSIGESLNLALLDARVTALINQIAAAIP